MVRIGTYPELSLAAARNLARLSQLEAETGYSTGKNASLIKGSDPKTWRSEDQVA